MKFTAIRYLQLLARRGGTNRVPFGIFVLCVNGSRHISRNFYILKTQALRLVVPYQTASGGWYIVVGIANRARAGRTGVGILVGRNFLIYRHVQTSSRAYKASTRIGHGSSFLGVQQSECDVNQNHLERVRAPLKKFKENSQIVVRNMAADRKCGQQAK